MAMKRLILVCGVSVSAMVCACASLSVYRVTDDTKGAPSVGDLQYYLPMTAINISGTVTIDTCTPGKKPGIGVSATLVPTISLEPDPNFHYRIPYQEARSWLKEINYSVTSQNGMFNSFNGTINDQSGPIAVATLTTIVQIAGAAVLGGHALDLVITDDQGFCKQVSTALRTIADDKDIITKAQYKLGGKDAGGKIIDPITDPIKKEEVDIQNQRIQIAQSDIDQQKKKLSRTFTFKWVPTRHDLAAGATIGSSYVIKTTIDINNIVGHILTPPGEKTPTGVPRVKPFLLTLAIDGATVGRQMDWTAPLTNDPAQTLDRPGGLVLRDPARAILRICREGSSECSTTQGPSPIGRVVETNNDSTPRQAVSLPQLGRIIVLPQKSGLFENVVLTAAIDANGSPTTISYHDSSTAAAGIAGIGTAANTASSAITAQNGAITAENGAAAAVTTARINQIQGPDVYNKALSDCYTSSAAIVKAGGIPGPCQ
jgi:hypothetical protein